MRKFLLVSMLMICMVSAASATVNPPNVPVIYNGSGVLVQSIRAKGGTGIIVTATPIVPAEPFGTKLLCDVHFGEYDVTKTPTADFPDIKSYIVHSCTPAY